MKYKGRSGKVLTEDKLREWYYAKNPNEAEPAFDWWLYFGIKCGAIKVVD